MLRLSGSLVDVGDDVSVGQSLGGHADRTGTTSTGNGRMAGATRSLGKDQMQELWLRSGSRS